jgi:RNA polymerase sigma-70 factor, ECF subfamily
MSGSRINMSSDDRPDQSPLLDRAKKGDQRAFQDVAEPYRRELQLHCYRMLGSLHDAEDLVQETFLRAWRGLSRFEGRASLRSWLYRIATNACLNTLASRTNPHRVVPETQGPPAGQMPEGMPATEVSWLEPYPDAALEGIADTAASPQARYEMREAVQLAFIAAIQLLPPRQRAVLLLRDVLGWSSGETAGLLEASIASVNSALQRARATLGKGSNRPTVIPVPDDRQRALLDRYVRAWEGADIDTLVALLREDAVLSMPPWKQWYRGREAARAFFTWAFVWKSTSYRPFRLIPTAANQQPAFGMYHRGEEEHEYRVHAIQLLTPKDDKIAALTFFRDPQLFAAFGLPAVLPMPGAAPSA